MHYRLVRSAVVFSLVAVVPFCIGWQQLIVVNENAPLTRPRPKNNQKPDGRPWSAVLGKAVRVEGIAWGSIGKEWGECVLIDGGRVYVENADFLNRGVEGKLVAVTGTLRLVHHQAAAKGAAGSGSSVDLFQIVHPTWKQIERVEWPWMEELE